MTEQRGPHASGAGGGQRRSRPDYRVWYVPPELHAQVKRLAKEQHRSIIGQVVAMMEEALRREHEQARRAEDGVRGAA